MYFKGVLLIWSWQRKIPCCSVHLHTPLVQCFTYKILTFQKERIVKMAMNWLLFFLSLAASLSLVHPTLLSFFPYHWSSVYVGLEGKFCLPFAPCFASLLSLMPASAEALRLLASVQRFASEAAICDLQMTWAWSSWWLLRRFCKSTLVICDMMRLESSPLAISTGKLLFSWHKIEPLYSR